MKLLSSLVFCMLKTSNETTQDVQFKTIIKWTKENALTIIIKFNIYLSDYAYVCVKGNKTETHLYNVILMHFTAETKCFSSFLKTNPKLFIWKIYIYIYMNRSRWLTCALNATSEVFFLIFLVSVCAFVFDQAISNIKE